MGRVERKKQNNNLIFEKQLPTISYQVIKSKRKTILISILPTKEVIVRAPIHISDEELERLVKTKSSWIQTKINQMPFREPVKTSYLSGDKIRYRGKEYTIRVEESSSAKSKVRLEQEELLVIKKITEKREIKELILQWYKERVKERVKERIDYYYSYVNRPYGKITIKNQKSRWGSCSSKGNLNFNWRIILMPDLVFDYIIVHELCHLKFLNHSKAYWNSVGEILPDYKQREAWLKENSSRLEF